jgi:hypothetical protein
MLNPGGEHSGQAAGMVGTPDPTSVSTRKMVLRSPLAREVFNMSTSTLTIAGLVRLLFWSFPLWYYGAAAVAAVLLAVRWHYKFEIRLDGDVLSATNLHGRRLRIGLDQFDWSKTRCGFNLRRKLATCRLFARDGQQLYLLVGSLTPTDVDALLAAIPQLQSQVQAAISAKFPART